MTVIVIAGGLSHEREVSLRSGRRVAQGLRDEGREVLEADVTSELLGLISANPESTVVPMLHGGLGESGALRQVLELVDVPFVGSSAAASRMTFDKSIATPTVQAAGIRTPQQATLPQDIFRELGAEAVMAGVIERIGLPLMVKPSRSGSALGVTKVERPEDLVGALVSAYAYGKVAVIEEFVAGTEVAITVLDEGDGPEALPAVEIRPNSGFYDYESRYTAGATRFVIPAELPSEALERAGELAVEAHVALGQRHFSRADLIVTDDGEPFFLEGNVAPGMTETSLAPLAFEAGGRTVGDVFARLVDVAR